MRQYSPTTAALFASRAPMHAHALVWISAKNRTTGAVETIGMWTGDDHRDFVIEGQTRTYYGAGSLIEIDPIRRRIGLQVLTQRLKLNGVTPEIQTALRGYDPRHAPVEIHRALFDPLTLILADTPHLLVRGFVDRIRFSTPRKGEAGEIEMDVASASRALTMPVSRKRSDASLRARAPEDGFRTYANQAEAVETTWGKASDRRATQPVTTPETRPDDRFGGIGVTRQ